MATKEIAIRHVVHFGEGRRRMSLPLAAPLPRNPVDPRYVACVQHRTACDCREARLAEDRSELQAEL